MAKNTPDYKNQKVVSSTVKKANIPQASKDLLQSMDVFLDQRLGWLIWVILGITFLFSLLLFDSRVSLTGDDSFYIIRAYDFIHSFKYPGFQGPLYPVVLSLFVLIFGISLIPLKVLSLIFVMGFMYAFFVAFRSRIPSSLLVFSLFIISINSFILYYASQTYNETFYLFLQIIMVLVFFRGFIDSEQEVTFKQDLRRHLLLAVCLLALTLTKNIGYSAVLAVAGYFLLRGQWKNILYSVLAFGMLVLVFQGIKYLLWNDGGLQFSTQGSGLMNKDYYNPQAGKEDFSGFVTRLIDNSNLYLSKHFLTIIGFRKVNPMMKVSSVVSILIYLLSIGSLIMTFKKNRYLFFTGLMAGSFLLISFVILQTRWDQSRLIIPVAPLLILMILSLFYYISSIREYKWLQAAVPVLALLVLFQSLAVTAGTVKENQQNSGRYGGLTPDWKNYLKASEWAAENLSKDAIVACRKPSISFVYGKGRNFYGIMQLPSYSTDIFINNWMKDDSAYALFNYADFGGKQLKPEFYAMLKNNMTAMLFIGDTVLFADKIDNNIKSSFYSEIKSAGINSITSASTLKSLLNQGKVVKLYYPDSLLNQLQNSGVTHILTANLRRNSTQKDGFIINTVERYMAFIQEKYPLIFTKVSQVGDDNNEPATIVKIEYEKYGRSVKIPDKK
jgi:hypothetical protein